MTFENYKNKHMKTKSLIIIITVLLFSSCKLFFPGPDKFTLQKQDYTGNELRVDGYYFKEFDSDCDRIQVFFLYRNGIILYGGCPCVEDINAKEEEYKEKGTWYKHVKEDRVSWGLFVIENDSIRIEKYEPPSGPGYLPAVIREGAILNDTTFRIIRRYRDSGKKIIKEVDDLYHFKKFSPKPDSTNSFF